MTGPGEYLPDTTEGITRVEDLPKPKRVERSRSYRRRGCPHCGHSAYHNRTLTRTLHDLGDLVANRPRDVVVTYSQHCCSRCRRYEWHCRRQAVRSHGFMFFVVRHGVACVVVA
jgi:type II secretory ATPase GspE/PulE/Tfp pilus assembly ATPase PilB-like protein